MLTFNIIDIILLALNLILIGIVIRYAYIVLIVGWCHARYSRSIFFDETLVRLLIDIVYSCYALYLHNTKNKELNYQRAINLIHSQKNLIN
jgi:hypothetical protein